MQNNEDRELDQSNSNINDTQFQEEETHDFYYEKIRFIIVDCRDSKL